MTDKPIPFSAPMVRALLDGRKTQTRRILKPQPDVMNGGKPLNNGRMSYASSGKWVRFPFATGDRLWVREAYYQRGHWEPVPGRQTKGGRQKWAFTPADNVICFDVPDGESVRLGRHHKDPHTVAWHKRLGRFMPRSASRLTLIVTDVKVERLRDISAEDAIAEGLVRKPFAMLRAMAAGCDWGFDGDDRYASPISAYAALWDHINGPGAWDASPWVAAYTFRVIQGNIDQIGGEA